MRSTEYYIKKTNKQKNRPTEPLDKWQKQSYIDKITQKVYTYTLTKREKGK